MSVDRTKRMSGPNNESLTYEDWLAQDHPKPEGFEKWSGAYRHWDRGHNLGWAIHCFNSSHGPKRERVQSSGKVIFTKDHWELDGKVIADWRSVAIRSGDLVLVQYNGQIIEISAATKVNGFNMVSRRDINNRSLREIMEENVVYTHKLIRTRKPAPYEMYE
jgi:hypothetical protein